MKRHKQKPNCFNFNRRTQSYPNPENGKFNLDELRIDIRTYGIFL